MTKKIVYENEEFNLLQAALNIENSMEDLSITILLSQQMQMLMECILDFDYNLFLQFFPELIKTAIFIYFKHQFLELETRKKLIIVTVNQRKMKF